MKIVFGVVLLLQLVAVSSQVVERVKLKMRIPELTDSYVVLYRYLGHQQVFIDSIRFGANGLAKYDGVKLEHGLYDIVMPNTTSFELIVSESQIYLETSLVTPSKDMRVKKSIENQVYYAFQQYVAAERKVLYLAYDDFNKGRLSQSQLDVLQSESSRKVRDERLRLVNQYGDLLVATLLKAGMNPEIDTNTATAYLSYLNNYLGNIAFDRPGLLNSPLIYSRVMSFLDEMVAPVPEEKIKWIDEIFKRCQKTPSTRAYLSKVLIEHYSDFNVVGNDEIFVHLVKGYIDVAAFPSAESKQLRAVANTIAVYTRGRTFEPLTVGSLGDLNAIEAKYTLVVLFDRSANKKELELIYNFGKSYERKGLQVCAIRIEGDTTALHAGHMTSWVQLDADREIKDELYMKKSVMLVLLDRDKKILARDITLDFLIDTINLWER